MGEGKMHRRRWTSVHEGEGVGLTVELGRMEVELAANVEAALGV